MTTAAEVPTLTANMIAAVCHEANRMYCLALGDTSQPEWMQAPEWQRVSSARGVQAVIDDPTITPAGLHAKWSADKVADGWVYGDVKNADAKTHPCLVPYEQLPEAQRRKDALFGGIVRALAFDFA